MINKLKKQIKTFEIEQISHFNVYICKIFT